MNYTVQRGDTLGTIAQKLLGSSTRWREIWTQNPSITDPNKLSIGQVIRIPSQSSAQTALVPVAQPVQAVSPASNLTNIRDVTPIPVAEGNKIAAFIRKNIIILAVLGAVATYLVMDKLEKQGER